MGGDGGEDYDYNDWMVAFAFGPEVVPTTPIVTTPVVTTPIITTPPAGLTCHDDLNDDFNDGTINADFWNILKEAESSIVEQDGSLNMNIRNVTENTLAKLLSDENVLEGDFIATVDLTATADGHVGEAALDFQHTGEERTKRVRVSLYAYPNGHNSLMFEIVGNDSVTAEVPDEITSVTVRIERLGSQINVYYKYGTMDYVLGTSTNDGFTDSVTVSLYSLSMGADYPDLQTSFDNFSLICPAAPSPTTTHIPDDTGFEENVMIYAGIVLYALGIAAFVGSKTIAKKSKLSL